MTQKRKIETIDSLKIENKALSDNARDLYSDLLNSENKPGLKVTIDATHSGRLTNLRVYPGMHMRKGVDTFLTPYPKPVLRHHSDIGEPIGRVADAKYIQLIKGDAFKKDFVNPGSGTGSGFIQLTANITDQDAIEKFLDERYLTVSTRQSMDGLFCSICGEDFRNYSSECEHIPGETYKIKSSDSGKSGSFFCYGITGPLAYKEVSAVNIPGDDEARVSKLDLIKQDSEETFTLFSQDNGGAIANIEITSPLGAVSIARMFNESVSSQDREKLTGKTIIAISPNFNNVHFKDQIMDESEKLENEEKEDVLEETENKNTADVETSAESGSSDTEETNDSTEEGVVAPKEETKEDSDKEEEKADNSAEIVRLKASLHDRDEEIRKLRKKITDSQTEIRDAYATALLNTRLFLGKSDVAHVKDDESRKAQIEKYSTRTIDSLKDSIEDLSDEVANAKNQTLDSRSVLERERARNPVRTNDVKGVKAKVRKTQTDKKDKKSKVREKVEAFNRYLEN